MCSSDLALICQVPGQPVVVDASASHLEQVLLNLILNASDALQGEGQVRVSIDGGTGGPVLVVDDNGPGVAPADRDRIFEPFYTGKPGSGWGLGLAVSRRMVAQYGGTLRVGDAPGGGARFEVALPMLQASPATAG